jgi:iron complex outermembrane receptor protein
MRHLGKLLYWSGTLALGAAGPALAQTAASSDELAEVVVTAEYRSVDIQKTPINITVVTQEDLLERGVVDTRTMLDSVPGLDMTNANPNNYIGLYGTASGGGSMWSDSSMAFNYGGIPLARQTSAAAAMYDLERVEVLKGPQGTLYGRNATTGALNLVIARPTPDFSGGGSITTGNYSTLNTQGHLNLPISDTVMTRFAFQNSKHDGYFSNGFDDANNNGFRGSLLFKPNENVSLLVWADLFRNRAKGPTTTMRYYFGNGQQWVDPSNPWFGFGPAGSCSDQRLCPSFLQASAGGVNANAATPPAIGNGNGFLDTSPTGEANYSVWAGPDSHSNANQDLYATQLDWKTDPGVLTAVAARVNTKIDYLSYSNGLRFGNRSDVYQDSVEVRFANNATGKLKWLVGGFWYKEHQNAFQFNMQNSGYALLSTPNLTDDNYAFFTDWTFSATDRFRISVGARYTNEKKTQDGYVTLNGVDPALFGAYGAVGITCFTSNITSKVLFAGFWQPSNFCVLPNGGNYKNDNVSGKAGLEFDVRDNSMLYLSAKQGFRSGGFTAGSESTYKPEKLMAYELGSRNRFLDGRLQANLSSFYWDYKDQQFSILHPFLVAGTFPAGVQTSYPYNVNGKLYGAELDLQARVLTMDVAHFNALYTSGRFDSIPTLINSAGVQTAITDVARVNLPKWTLNGGYDHKVPVATGGSITLGADAHYESAVFMQQVASTLLVPGSLRGSFTKWNFNVGYEAADNKWSLTAFLDNATNEAVVGVGSSGQVANGTFFKSASNPTDARSATLDPPRTYGLRINANF